MSYLLRRLRYPLMMLLALCICVVVSVLHSSVAISQAESVPVPPEAENCVDMTSMFAAGGAELIATESVDGTDYFLIYTYEDSANSEEFPIALLVSSPSSDSCTSELWNTPGDFLPYADYVPLAAAIKFREVEYSIQLERMSREEFVNAFDLSELDLLEEEKKALENMGLLDEIRGD